MRFVLKPAVRQLALVFPVLLIAMPIVINAADDKPGPVLPPPSLYDTVPAPNASAPEPGGRNAPVSPAQLQSAPVQAPGATAPSPCVEATPAAPAQPPAAATSAYPDTGVPTRSSRPWYRRLFSWVPSSSSQPVQQASPESPRSPRDLPRQAGVDITPTTAPIAPFEPGCWATV